MKDDPSFLLTVEQLEDSIRRQYGVDDNARVGVDNAQVIH